MSYKLIRIIDEFTDRIGRCFSWLVFILVIIVCWEVLCRLLFRTASIWTFDLTYMVYGSIFMLGAPFTLRRGGHIRVDIISAKFSARSRGWIDAIGYLFLLPVVLMLFYVSVFFTWESWRMNEHAEQTVWGPLLWPYKASLSLSFLLLLLQGISELLKSIYAIRTNSPFDHKQETSL